VGVACSPTVRQQKFETLATLVSSPDVRQQKFETLARAGECRVMPVLASKQPKSLQELAPTVRQQNFETLAALACSPTVRQKNFENLAAPTCSPAVCQKNSKRWQELANASVC
jgi:hypothetical protein